TQSIAHSDSKRATLKRNRLWRSANCRDLRSIFHNRKGIRQRVRQKPTLHLPYTTLWSAECHPPMRSVASSSTRFPFLLNSGHSDDRGRDGPSHSEAGSRACPLHEANDEPSTDSLPRANRRCCKPRQFFRVLEQREFHGNCLRRGASRAAACHRRRWAAVYHRAHW